MATISSAGIGSGLDINGLVSQILSVESRPLASLDKKEAGYQAKLAAYGSIKSAVSAFQSAMQGLSSPTRFQTLRASTADSTILAASAAPNAAPGNYAIEVKQLAQAQKLASRAFTNVTDSVGTGTLTIQFGTTSGGVFTANAAKATQAVTIGSGNSSLSGVRDAINAAKVGVTASILNDGTGNKLILTSADTGAASSLKITVTDTSDGSNTDNAGLSQLAYDPAVAGTPPQAGKNLTETQAAQNALLKVDGIDNISKSTNVVTDVVQGVTLTLLKQSAANTSTLVGVARDTAGVKTAVEGFVKAFNDVNKTIRDLTAYNAETKKGAVLQGDSSVLTILSQIRSQLTANLAGLSGSYTQLSQIGVSFQTDGSLVLDSSKLQTALDTNFSEIAGLFASLGKPSDSLVNYVSAAAATKPGAYDVAITQLATRGLLNGTATAALADTNDDGTFDAAFAVTSSNDTFSIKVDGVQSGTITLAQGNYTTAAALIAELQSKINGDSALRAAGVSVTAGFDNAAGAGSDRLTITSDRYGSASKVEIMAVDTTTAAAFGLAVGTGTDGVDVAGTINGVAASGSGRSLTGAAGTAVEGLKLDIVGGAIGSRGTVNYSQGYAWLLEKLAGQILGSNGAITSRTAGLNKSISDIADRREVLNYRLQETEKRLRTQFTALDGLLAKLRATSDSLSRQLATLPGSGGTQGSR